MKTELKGRIYCPKCGLNIDSYANNYNANCRICKTPILPVPYGYGFNDDEIAKWLQENKHGDFSQHWKQLEQHFFDEIISKSPEFDQYLYDHKEEILAEQSIKINASIAHGKAIRENSSKVITCPYCQSTNTKKISVTSRFMSTGIFGLASGKIGKQWKCISCGSFF